LLAQVDAQADYAHRQERAAEELTHQLPDQRSCDERIDEPVETVEGTPTRTEAAVQRIVAI
jgi:hypothetical protein